LFGLVEVKGFGSTDGMVDCRSPVGFRLAVPSREGRSVGLSDIVLTKLGTYDGGGVGSPLDIVLGLPDGKELGSCDTTRVGLCVGDVLGSPLGSTEGISLRPLLEELLEACEGRADGLELG
jgi:hypothetical protein